MKVLSVCVCACACIFVCKCEKNGCVLILKWFHHNYSSKTVVCVQLLKKSPNISILNTLSSERKISLPLVSFTQIRILLLSVTMSYPTLWPHVSVSRASLSFTISQSSLKFISLIQRCYLTISSSASLFFCLQSFPASGSFPMSCFFIGGIHISQSLYCL